MLESEAIVSYEVMGVGRAFATKVSRVLSILSFRVGGGIWAHNL